MTNLQIRIYNSINEDIDNIIGELVYEAISSAKLSEDELDKLDSKVKADLRVALTQTLKEV